MDTNAPVHPDAVPVSMPIVILATLLVPVLVVAFAILYIMPHDVGGSLFAWPVNPRMSSMMLGATYMGGAYFFLIVVVSRKWRHVRLGLVPVTAFAATLGLATVLHWQNFVHERFSFLTWAFLYFTVPFVLPILWYRNERRAHPADNGREGVLPGLIRWAFGALGLVLLVAGLLLFVTPQLMIAVWPWTLTPLTSRIMSAMFLLPGLTGLGIAYDGTWAGSRFLFQAQALSIVLMLTAAGAARADFDWSDITSYLFVGGMSFILLLILLAHALPKPARTSPA